MIGKTIQHYKIAEKLGQGGMGVVYKAEDTKLKRDVAIKFLPRQISANEEERARFKIEAQAAAALNHPNIATIHAIEEVDDERFIVMEYIEGQELKNLAKVENLRKVLDYATQIASGLLAAHAKGVIHRDIKSANIMVTEEGQVKIMDFGLAKIRGSAQFTKVGTTLGTAAYMSPEQAQGAEIDHRSDIWSLGVVLYEMLSGQLPFKGDYEQAVIYSILNEDAADLAEIRSDVPEQLSVIVQKCLQKDAGERYQDIGDIIADFNLLQHPATTTPLATVVHPPAAKPAFRNRKTGYAAGIVLFVFLAAFWFLTERSSQTRPGVEALNDKSIAVMYFENRSSEANLEKILVDMLTTNLARHEDLKVVSSQRLFDILKNMGKLDVPVIDQSVATEVARKAQVKTMLLGSINQIGSRFRINSQLVDVPTGNIIGAEQVAGEKVDDVFEMVDQLTERISRKLQVAGSPAGQPLRITDVTTASFDAYKYYQMAVEDEWLWRFSSAAENYRKATELDSTFAMAHLRQAVATGLFLVTDPLADVSGFAHSIRLAERHATKASPREQLFIEALSAFLRRDFQKSESLFAKYTERHPDDKEGWYWLAALLVNRGVAASDKALELDPAWANAYNMLAFAYSWNGHHEQAISAVKKYISLQPDVSNTYDSAFEVYVQAGRFDDAEEICRQALQRNSEWVSFHRYLGYLDLFRGDGERARDHLRKVIELNPGRRFRIAMNIGYTYLHEGRYKDTISQFKSAQSLAAEEDDKNQLLRASLDLAKVYTIQGERAKTVEALAQARRLSEQVYPEGFNPVQVISEYLTGRMLLAEQNVQQANAVVGNIRELVAKHDDDALLKNFYHFLVADLLLVNKDGEAASGQLTQLSGWMGRLHPHSFTLLARANAMTKKTTAAIEIYEKFYNHITSRNPFNGGDYFSYFLERPKVNYYLARLYEQEGEVQQAQRYYATFLDLWKNADSDLPELVDARQRYSQLKRNSEK